MNQAFESIWNVNANEFTRPLSRRAIVLSLQGLPAINEVSKNSELREKLALASLFAGLAISQTRTSICHSISYPLTLKYGIEHGMACSFSMLEVFKYNFAFIKDDLELIELELKQDSFTVLKALLSSMMLMPILLNHCQINLFFLSQFKISSQLVDLKTISKSAVKTILLR